MQASRGDLLYLGRRPIYTSDGDLFIPRTETYYTSLPQRTKQLYLASAKNQAIEDHPQSRHFYALHGMYAMYGKTNVAWEGIKAKM
jgi:hypothetical protein